MSLCKGSWFDSLFRSFDRDGSGYLDSNELASLLTEALEKVNIKHKVSHFEAKIAMKALDKDKDGKLSQEETYQIFNYFTNNFKEITGK